MKGRAWGEQIVPNDFEVALIFFPNQTEKWLMLSKAPVIVWSPKCSVTLWTLSLPVIQKSLSFVIFLGDRSSGHPIFFEISTWSRNAFAGNHSKRRGSILSKWHPFVLPENREKVEICPCRENLKVITLQEGQVRVSLYSLISSLRISSMSEAISIFFKRSTFRFRMAVSSCMTMSRTNFWAKGQIRYAWIGT